MENIYIIILTHSIRNISRKLQWKKLALLAKLLMSVSYYLKTSRFDLSRIHYWHGAIWTLNVNTICKEADIGLMIAITLNIRLRTSSTRTSGVRMLVPSVVPKERTYKVAARPLRHYQRQWHDRYWELWPANPISNSFWHSLNYRLATSIECYNQVYILHNLV